MWTDSPNKQLRISVLPLLLHLHRDLHPVSFKPPPIHFNVGGIRSTRKSLIAKGLLPRMNEIRSTSEAMGPAVAPGAAKSGIAYACEACRVAKVKCQGGSVEGICRRYGSTHIVLLKKNGDERPSEWLTRPVDAPSPRGSASPRSAHGLDDES